MCTVLYFIRCISHLLCWMSLGFIAREYGLAGPSAKSLRATLLALVVEFLFQRGSC